MLVGLYVLLSAPFDLLGGLVLPRRYGRPVVAQGFSRIWARGAVGHGFCLLVVALVLLAAGRPVLVVPYAGSFADAGKRVLVAWNASREATRALTESSSSLTTEVRSIWADSGWPSDDCTVSLPKPSEAAVPGIASAAASTVNERIGFARMPALSESSDTAS